MSTEPGSDAPDVGAFPKVPGLLVLFADDAARPLRFLPTEPSLTFIIEIPRFITGTGTGTVGVAGRRGASHVLGDGFWKMLMPTPPRQWKCVPKALFGL